MMPEPIPLHARKPRGPEHPPPPPPTDPRLQLFPLLPGEDGAAWTRHAGEVLDRLEPHGPGRSHGSDLQEPAHFAALTAALRLFLAQRKARATGLLGPVVADDGDASRTCEPDGRPRTREPEPGAVPARTYEPDGPARTREPDTSSCTSEPERPMGTVVPPRTSEPEQPALHVRTRRTAAHIRTQAASVDDSSRRAAAHVRTQAAAVRPA